MPSKPAKNDQLVTDQQVAQRWGISPTSVRRKRYGGSLPTVRVGRLARIPLSAVLAYEAAQTGA